MDRRIAGERIGARARVPRLRPPMRGCVLGLWVLWSACGGRAGPAEVTVEELEGEWTASQFELVSRASPAQSVNVLAQGGSFALTVEPEARHGLFVSLPDGSLVQQTGPAVVQGRRLFLVNEAKSEVLLFQFTLSGDSLRLTTDDLPYDFDRDGRAEPARGTLVLERGPAVPT